MFDALNTEVLLSATCYHVQYMIYMYIRWCTYTLYSICTICGLSSIISVFFLIDRMTITTAPVNNNGKYYNNYHDQCDVTNIAKISFLSSSILSFPATFFTQLHYRAYVLLCPMCVAINWTVKCKDLFMDRVKS